MLKRGLLALTLIAGFAHAAPEPKSGEDFVQPYSTLSERVTTDRKIVREFFWFGCSFCAKYDLMLARWGATLPKEYKYIRTPIVGKDQGMVNAAMAYYAALYADQNKIQLFMNQAFSLIHEGGMDPGSIKTYALAAQKVGISLPKMKEYMKSAEIRKLVVETAEISSRYELKATPTLGISGRFTVTPEIVAGNPDVLIQLLNAMVSKDMQGM